MTGAWDDPQVRAAVRQVTSQSPWGTDASVVPIPESWGMAEDATCIEQGEGCDGPVAYRMPLSGTGQSFPRCQGHWFARLDRQAQIDRRYPDQATPPRDFDPTYAGEVWDDDGW